MSAPCSFFKVACQDAARIVSLLSLNSSHVTTPIEQKTFIQKWKDKAVFFGRFFHMVFIKGFTPVVFDMMPYPLWQLLTFGIYIFRLVVLPIAMQLSGMVKYASWDKPAIGSALPLATDAEAVCNSVKSLSAESRLAQQSFGDADYERMLMILHRKTTHLSPHSQSPGHPFISGFPGNFMDHLTGVYKVLFAWHQPQFVVRAGLYHSVYGTYDYRAGVYDLKDGRDPLRATVGSGAEELAFAICTSDRLGLIFDLLVAMYGQECVSGWGLLANIKRSELQSIKMDGNAYPPLKGELSEEGFPVRNHITQKMHILPPAFFAHFIVVFAADFMDQGALPFGSTDMDICLFQFLRFRFFSDVIRFVSRYLYAIPPVFKKYMWDASFTEPSREEVILLKKLWTGVFEAPDGAALRDMDKARILEMIEKYPYLPEPHLVLAASADKGETIKGKTQAQWAEAALAIIEEWGTLTIKDEKISLAVVLDKIKVLTFKK